jgi:hypothetical protein
MSHNGHCSLASTSILSSLTSTSCHAIVVQGANTMTFRQALLKLLEDNGLFPNQAQAVLELYMNHEMAVDMQGRIDEQVSVYPEILLDFAWSGVRLVAVEWIDKNMPLHWARPLLLDAPLYTPPEL